MIDAAITSFYAALCAAILIALTFRVILERRRSTRAWGADRGSRLEHLSRAHGNFAEYAPMVLILMLLAEAQGAPDGLVHLIGLSLVAGRLLHAWGLSERPDRMVWRVSGMVLTINALGFGALGVLLPLL